MAVYLKIPNINGDVSSQGHKNWVELQSMDIAVNRQVTTQVGKIANREATVPSFKEVEITKQADQSSPLLFQKACQGASLGEVTIHLCRTSEALEPHGEYLLSDVIISHYSDVVDGQGQSYERLKLNYAKIQKIFTPRGVDNKAGSPIRSGYDLEVGKTI